MASCVPGSDPVTREGPFRGWVRMAGGYGPPPLCLCHTYKNVPIFSLHRFHDLCWCQCFARDQVRHAFSCTRRTLDLLNSKRRFSVLTSVFARMYSAWVPRHGTVRVLEDGFDELSALFLTYPVKRTSIVNMLPVPLHEDIDSEHDAWSRYTRTSTVNTWPGPVPQLNIAATNTPYKGDTFREHGILSGSVSLS
jgi:hypothetical protein